MGKKATRADGEGPTPQPSIKSSTSVKRSTNFRRLSFDKFSSGVTKALIGNVGFAGTNLRNKAKKRREQSKKEDRTQIREAIIYVVFMSFFCVCTMRNLFNSEVFFFGENVRRMFTETQLQSDALNTYSPAWSKTFKEVSSREELYQYLLGGFLHGLMPTEAVEGIHPVPLTAERVTRPSHVLGNLRVVGAARIGQIRALPRNCSLAVPPQLRENNVFHSGESVNGNSSGNNSSLDYTCYGRFKSGLYFSNFEFDRKEEDISDFSMLLPATTEMDEGLTGDSLHMQHGTTLVPELRLEENQDVLGGLVYRSTNSDGSISYVRNSSRVRANQASAFLQRGRPFSFDGFYGSTRLPQPAGTTAKERARYMSSYTTRHWNTYPSPGYTVTIDPAMGRAKAAALIHDMRLGDYMDEQTKAVFVDVTVYSAELDYACVLRLSAETTGAGGLNTGVEVDVMRLWNRHTAEDKIYEMLWFVVVVFYARYTWMEVKRLRKMGWQYWHQFFSWVMCFNILFFVIGTVARYSAQMYLPKQVQVEGDFFTDFRSAVSFYNSGFSVQATNVFLNWFKLVKLLSYSPDFGVMTETLYRSAKGIAGFGLIFFIVFIGFAQAHCMVFHSRLYAFRTFGMTCYQLTIALLGDFDFNALQQAHPFMGPILFIMFIAIAIFVVLNMLIAIISNAYEEAKQVMRQKRPVNLIAEARAYMGDLGADLRDKLCCRSQDREEEKKTSPKKTLSFAKPRAGVAKWDALLSGDRTPTTSRRSSKVCVDDTNEPGDRGGSPGAEQQRRRSSISKFFSRRDSSRQGAGYKEEGVTDASTGEVVFPLRADEKADLEAVQGVVAQAEALEHAAGKTGVSYRLQMGSGLLTQAYRMLRTEWAQMDGDNKGSVNQEDQERLWRKRAPGLDFDGEQVRRNMEQQWQQLVDSAKPLRRVRQQHLEKDQSDQLQEGTAGDVLRFVRVTKEEFLWAGMRAATDRLGLSAAANQSGMASAARAVTGKSASFKRKQKKKETKETKQAENKGVANGSPDSKQLQPTPLLQSALDKSDHGIATAAAATAAATPTAAKPSEATARRSSLLGRRRRLSNAGSGVDSGTDGGISGAEAVNSPMIRRRSSLAGLNEFQDRNKKRRHKDAKKKKKTRHTSDSEGDGSSASGQKLDLILGMLTQLVRKGNEGGGTSGKNSSHNNNSDSGSPGSRIGGGNFERGLGKAVVDAATKGGEKTAQHLTTMVEQALKSVLADGREKELQLEGALAESEKRLDTARDLIRTSVKKSAGEKLLPERTQAMLLEMRRQVEESRMGAEDQRVRLTCALELHEAACEREKKERERAAAAEMGRESAKKEVQAAEEEMRSARKREEEMGKACRAAAKLLLRSLPQLKASELPAPLLAWVKQEVRVKAEVHAHQDEASFQTGDEGQKEQKQQQEYQQKGDQADQAVGEDDELMKHLAILVAEVNADEEAAAKDELFHQERERMSTQVAVVQAVKEVELVGAKQEVAWKGRLAKLEAQVEGTKREAKLAYALLQREGELREEKLRKALAATKSELENQAHVHKQQMLQFRNFVLLDEQAQQNHPHGHEHEHEEQLRTSFTFPTSPNSSTAGEYVSAAVSPKTLVFREQEQQLQQHPQQQQQQQQHARRAYGPTASSNAHHAIAVNSRVPNALPKRGKSASAARIGSAGTSTSNQKLAGGIRPVLRQQRGMGAGMSGQKLTLAQKKQKLQFMQQHAAMERNLK